MPRRSVALLFGLVLGCFKSAPEVSETGDTGDGESTSTSTSTSTSISTEGSERGEPPEGCRDGTVEQIYNDAMVGCDGALTQCEAHTLCNDGWHLCPFDEYNERGGDITMATEYRWLAACVREVPSDALACPPTTNICGGDCLSSGGFPPEPVRFSCQDETVVAMTMDVGPLGVLAGAAGPRTHLVCPGNSPCSFVETNLTNQPSGATCCLSL